MLLQCGTAITQAKGRGRDEKDSVDLLSLAGSVIVKQYKEKCPNKVDLITSILDKQLVANIA